MIHKYIHRHITFVFKGQYSNGVSKFSIFRSIIKPPFPIPYCQLLHGNGYFCDKKTKRKPYITQIFVILLTVVCYPVVASSPRRLAYLSKKKFNMWPFQLSSVFIWIWHLQAGSGQSLVAWQWHLLACFVPDYFFVIELLIFLQPLCCAWLFFVT